MTQSRPQSAAEERLAAWVREHARAVRGYLLALVRRPDVADDLSQEVFRRAWQARDRYREQGTPRAYLLKIADRLACDWGRKIHRELHFDAAEWRRIEPAGEEADPPAQLEFKEAERELTAALDSLSPVQKRVLLLRYYGDLSFQEIAETISCPLGTALSHCRRGLLAVRAPACGEVASKFKVKRHAMNESNPELQQLERATSRLPQAGTLPAGEDSELRESWVTFSRLAERAGAESPFDEQAFLAEISNSIETRPMAPRHVWLALFAALAASVLVCLIVGGYVASQGWSKNQLGGTNSQPGEKERPSKQPLLAQGTASPEFSWDDALDERISYLSQTLYGPESSGHGADRSLRTLGAQVEEFGKDLESGSL